MPPIIFFLGFMCWQVNFDFADNTHRCLDQSANVVVGYRSSFTRPKPLTFSFRNKEWSDLPDVIMLDGGFEPLQNQGPGP